MWWNTEGMDMEDVSVVGHRRDGRGGYERVGHRRAEREGCKRGGT